MAGVILKEQTFDKHAKAAELALRWLPLRDHQKKRIPDRDRRVWFKCVPDSGSTPAAPAFGVVEITDVILEGDQPVVVYDRPSAANLTNTAVLWGQAVPSGATAGAEGLCTLEPSFAAYNTAGTPAFDEEWGTEANSYLLKQGNTGYRILGAANAGAVYVQRWPVQQTNELVRFELTASLSLGGSAAAEIVEWNGAAYAKNGEVITVRDFTASPGTWRGISGYRGWAQLKDDRGNYEIVQMEMQSRWIEFTLTEDMGFTIPGRAGASITGANGDFWEGKTPDTGTPDTEVYDDRGLFARALTGAKGLAVWDEIENSYQILQCQTKAGFIAVTLGTGGLTTGTALGNASGFTLDDYWGTQQDVQAPTVNATLVIEDDAGLFARSFAGAKIVCVYDAIDNVYRAVQGISTAGWVKYTTAQVWGATNTDQALSSSIINYGGTQQDFQDPGSSFTIYDLTGTMNGLASGHEGIAVYDYFNNRYVDVSGKPGAAAGNEPVRFELTATLSLGGSAAAKTVIYTGGAYALDAVITVRDFTASPGTWRGVSGYRGWAVLKADRGDYEIIWMERKARWIEFTLTADMSSGSANASITSSDGDYWEGKNPDAGTPDVVVYDDRGLFTRAKNTAKGIAVWDEIEDHYAIVECQTKAGWVKYTTTEVWGATVSNQAGSNVINYGGTQQDVQDPGSTEFITDLTGNLTGAASGHEGIAIYDAANARYVDVSGPDTTSSSTYVIWAGEKTTTHNFTGSSGVHLTLTEVVNSSGFTHATGGGNSEITVPTTGYYKLSYGMRFKRPSTSSNSTILHMQPGVYDGSSWSDLTSNSGRLEFMIFPDNFSSAERWAISKSVVVALDSGDKVRLTIGSDSSHSWDMLTAHLQIERVA